MNGSARYFQNVIDPKKISKENKDWIIPTKTLYAVWFRAHIGFCHLCCSSCR